MKVDNRSKYYSFIGSNQPSLDSTSKSPHQLLKTKGNTRLAIINIFNVITLNHTGIINRKAEIGNKVGHRRSPGIKKAFEVDLSQP